jgi:peroxiredoxin family protein
VPEVDGGVLWVRDEATVHSEAEVMAAARSGAGVKVAACSMAGDDVVACSEAGIEDGRRHRHDGV